VLDPQTINLAILPSLLLEQRSEMPEIAAIYFAIDSQGVVQYIGRAKNLKHRWEAHHKGVDLALMGGVRIAYLETDCDLLPEVEKALIQYFKPPLNGFQKKVKKSKTGGFSKQVSFRITDDLYEELYKRALEKDLTVAEYTRELITALVKEQQQCS
jgi:hypothetical protein